MKTEKMKRLLREFEDMVDDDSVEEVADGSLAIVSVSLADESLLGEVDEIAIEYNGEAVVGGQTEDVLYSEYRFADPIDADEFHDFLIGSDWFGDEIVSVAMHVEESEMYSSVDTVDTIPLEDECECKCSCETCDCDQDAEYNLEDDEDAEYDLGDYEDDEDDVQQHIDQQEAERDEFQTNYVADAGGFNGDAQDHDFGFEGIEEDPNVYKFEETDVFNAQGQGGEVRGDFSKQIEELKKIASANVRATLREYRVEPYKSDAPEYDGEQDSGRKFKEHKPTSKKSWNGKWKNDGGDSSAQSNSHPYRKTTNGKKKDPKTHRIHGTVEKKGQGWDNIQRSTDQYTDGHDDHFAGKQIDDFHSKKPGVRFMKKQGDLKEARRKPRVVDTIDGKGEGWDEIQKSSSEDSSSAQMERTKQQTKAFFSKSHKVPFAKDTDLKEEFRNRFQIHCIIQYWNGKLVVGDFNTAKECRKFFEDHGVDFSNASYDRRANEYVYVQGDPREKSLDESLDETLEETMFETVDETVDEDVIMGGYTVPLGAKPANFKRNADVWRKNSGSKNPKANDTVKSNQAPTQSATEVKKDKRKAKAPFTSFADQSNVPFKHKSRTTKYGVSDSPASAIGGQ